MTEDERSIIRSGVDSDSTDYTCAGCGEIHTVRKPKRKEGGHVALILVDGNDQASEPVYAYIHSARCGAKWLKKIWQGSGESEPEEEAPATPLRRRQPERQPGPAAESTEQAASS